MAEFELYVDDNYHYMDEESRYKSGSFASYEEALMKAKAIVDLFLEENYSPGMTSRELYAGYIGFGEDPFIVPAGNPRFSAWDYARERCGELCRDEDAIASVLRYPQWPPELEGFREVLAAARSRKGLGMDQQRALAVFEYAVANYPKALPAQKSHWLRLEHGREAYTVFLRPDRFQLSVDGILPEKVEWEVRFRGSGRCDCRAGNAALAFEHMRDAAASPDFTLRVSAE